MADLYDPIEEGEVEADLQAFEVIGNLMGPGDRVRVRGIMRGTVKVRQLIEGVYSYRVEMDNGESGTYHAPDLKRIGEAAPDRCDGEKALDLAWEEHDEADRVARERSLNLFLRHGEIEWFE